ncbi:hypothetical protein EBZ37_05875, partial [bacterium]|nr:hypothetical protein [bacterium]
MKFGWSWSSSVVFLILNCSGVWAAGRESVFSDATVSSGKDITLKIELPKGYKLSDSAPHRLELFDLGANRVVRTWRENSLRFPQMGLGKVPGSAKPYRLEGRIFVCDKIDKRICVSLRAKQQIFSGGPVGQS